jgi:condensin complex subunit 1
MDDRFDFDINDALKHYLSDPSSISTPEAPSDLVDCENDPDSLTAGLINSCLNPVVDSVAENPEAITRRSNFDTLQFLLKCAPSIPLSQQCHDRPQILSSSSSSSSRRRKSILSSTQFAIESNPNCALFVLSRTSSLIPATSLSKILDLVVSALSAEADLAHADIEADEQESIAQHKQLLEIYGFLLQWTVAVVETKATEKQASAPAARGRKGAKPKSGAGKDANWDPAAQLQTALDVMGKVMKLKLSRIFVTTSERDAFVSLFTRPVYLVLENEARVKSTAMKMHAFKVLCVAVKHHGHAFGESTKPWYFDNSLIIDSCPNLDCPESIVL